MASVVPFPDGTVEEISRAIVDTVNGLSGSDITRVFRTCDIGEMNDGETTKWKRIANTFAYVQRQHKSANRFCAFIKTALQPARWARRPEAFAVVRDAVNVQLAFHGLMITKEGLLHRVAAATNRSSPGTCKPDGGGASPAQRTR
jgi:hypothetical protein